MLSGFERLESRNLLAHFDIDIDGPRMAFAGEDVAYVVTVTNRDSVDVTATGKLSFWTSPLSGPTWMFDGESLPLPEFVDELGVQESGDLTATGRLPNGDDHFVFCVSVSTQNNPGLRTVDCHTTVVLDPLFDSYTIGADFSWHRTHGFGLVGHDHDASFHSAQPAGDVNEDGVDDVYLTYLFRADTREGSVELQLIRHTFFGTTEPPPNVHSVSLRASDADVLETWEGFDTFLQLPPEFRPVAKAVGRYPVGDIDGDGFEDIVEGNPDALYETGTATIFFGPDFRDNFVILGSTRARQMNADIAFGIHAGALGDINGDGMDDFYVVRIGTNHELAILYGRSFDRDIVGDINRDGTVGFDDFLILAANFGQEDTTRAEGDLDGDGVVTFEDFVILSRTLERTKTPGDSATFFL